MKKTYLLLSFLIIGIISCQSPKTTEATNKPDEDWKTAIKGQLDYLGHRNWILVVDKAFPLQTAQGLTTINTHEDLLTVLKYTLGEIEACSHVKPNVYTNKELSYITNSQVAEIDTFRQSLNEVIGKHSPQVMLHDDVFTQIDYASKLFKVLVIKTDKTIPYSSVFLQLDCKYWTSEKEQELRRAMEAGQTH